MKLSEAIMLGSATCKMVDGDMNSCAIGSAMNAVGDKHFGINRYAHVGKFWPWLWEDPDRYVGVSDLCMEIMVKFDVYVVLQQSMTLEQLVDYVRSIEPDCGDCNRFDCSCVKSEAAPVTEEVTA